MTVAFAALCLAASVGGGEFVIAERGRAENPPIVIPADAAPSFRYAAEELRDHVRGMTDVELAISDFGARGVFLEKGEADLGDDGFRIRTGADGVHILISRENGDFSSASRLAGDSLYKDDAVLDLGNVALKHTLYHSRMSS